VSPAARLVRDGRGDHGGCGRCGDAPALRRHPKHRARCGFPGRIPSTGPSRGTQHSSGAPLRPRPRRSERRFRGAGHGIAPAPSRKFPTWPPKRYASNTDLNLMPQNPSTVPCRAEDDQSEFRGRTLCFFYPTIPTRVKTTGIGHHERSCANPTPPRTAYLDNTALLGEHGGQCWHAPTPTCFLALRRAPHRCSPTTSCALGARRFFHT
jgi:hypothetical protein